MSVGARGSRVVVCADCGRTWSGVEARFCGHCGAALTAPSSGRDERGSAGRDLQRWRWILVVVGVFVAGAIVVAAVGGADRLELGPAEEGSTEVELPSPDEVPDPDEGQEPPDGDGSDDALQQMSLGCEPEGCELWRWEGVDGQARVIGASLIHAVFAERPGGSSLGQGASDEDQPFAEALLTARSALTGELEWEAELAVRLDPDTSDHGGSLVPVGDGLVLIQLADRLLGLLPEVQEVAWTVPVDHPVVEAVRAEDGTLIAWGPVPPEGRETRPDEEAAGPGDREGTADEEGSNEATGEADPWERLIEVVAIEPASGAPLWSSQGVAVLGIGADTLLLLDGGGEGVTALDLTTGDVLWQRAVGPELSRRPAPLRDGRVVLVDGASVEILDARTGDLRDSIELGFEPQGPPTVFGELLLVDETIEADDGPPSSVRATKKVYDLGDLAAAPRTFDDVTSMLEFRDGDVAAGWGWSIAPPLQVALLFQDGDRALIEMLDPEGVRRWASEVPLIVDDCCVGLRRGRDDTWMVLQPPDRGAGLPTIIETATGMPTGHIDLPQGMHPDGSLLLLDGFAMVPASDHEGPSTVLAGPEGQVRASGVNGPVSLAPVPIFRGAEGLIALDPQLLFGTGEGGADG